MQPIELISFPTNHYWGYSNWVHLDCDTHCLKSQGGNILAHVPLSTDNSQYALPDLVILKWKHTKLTERIKPKYGIDICQKLRLCFSIAAWQHAAGPNAEQMGSNRNQAALDPSLVLFYMQQQQQQSQQQQHSSADGQQQRQHQES